MFYGYFCATLPQLFPDQKPEISLAEFDELASAEMSRERWQRLVSWEKPDAPGYPAVYRKMRDFDAYLNWRIALARAEKLGAAAEFTVPEEFHSEVDYSLPAAATSRDAAERERAVDMIRWRKIDELESGHELDFTALCCYRMRLLALEKFTRRAANDGGKIFEEAVNRIAGNGVDL